MYETEDLYEILQLHPSAHPDVIQAAYRRLAFLYHPDRNPSPEAAEMMKRLNLAYETLSDPDRRAAYDRTRSAQQGQRTEARRRDTYSERPGTSGSTSQSGTTTPTTPPKARGDNSLKIIAGGVALAVVVAIVAAALSAGGGQGNGDDGGGDGGSRSVAVSPTRTPRPTIVPTPRPTATLRPTATPTRIPTPTPRPTATPAPRPIAALPSVGGDYFTRGSSQDDVLHAQGTPGEIHNYEILGYETWYYGRSTITFSLPDSRVTEWDDEGNLKVRLLPKTGQSTTPGYFTRGSSQDDVLHAQGTPGEIHNYEILGYETWYYGRSTITFSLPDSRVTEWDDEGNLKVRLLPKTGQSTTPGYFTRGSSQDDVLHVQGTPGEIHNYEILGYETWYYGRSTITFSLPDSRVTEWDDEGNLKVRLLPKTGQSTTPGYFTRGSSR